MISDCGRGCLWEQWRHRCALVRHFLQGNTIIAKKKAFLFPRGICYLEVPVNRCLLKVGTCLGGILMRIPVDCDRDSDLIATAVPA